jgi:hypothetical protein
MRLGSIIASQDRESDWTYEPASQTRDVGTPQLRPASLLLLARRFLPLIGPQGGGRNGNRRMYDVGHDEDAPNDSQREIGDQEYGKRDGEHHFKAARPANLVGVVKPQSRGLLAIALARPRRSVCMNG